MPKMTKAERQQQLAEQLNAWNAMHPPGSKVRYYPVAGRGQHTDTITRSEAWIAGGHSIIVLIQGKAGGVSIAHLERITDDAE